MARISKDRIDSNIRVSNVEVAVARAVSSAHEEGLTYLEIIEALGNVQQRWIQNGRIKETPTLDN